MTDVTHHYTAMDGQVLSMWPSSPTARPRAISHHGSATPLFPERDLEFPPPRSVTGIRQTKSRPSSHPSNRRLFEALSLKAGVFLKGQRSQHEHMRGDITSAGFRASCLLRRRRDALFDTCPSPSRVAVENASSSSSSTAISTLITA
jgi:hypothetical protein